MVHKAKWIKTDDWRGYEQSANAVIGSSDTGMWSDSPARSDEVAKELQAFQSELNKAGIESEIKTTQSSNAFMVKRWVVVPAWEHKKAMKIANDYLKKKEGKLQYLHGVE